MRSVPANAADSAMPMPFAKSIATWTGRARCANSRTCAAYCADTSTCVTVPLTAASAPRSPVSTIRSMSLMPVAPEIGTALARQSLQPFHSFVLWDAVIITLPSALSEALAK